MIKILTYLLTVAFTTSCLAAEKEELSITTYYPSPYGVYNELQVKNKMAVGDVTTDPNVGNLDILHPEQLYIGNSILLKELSADPPDPESLEGQIIYNSPDKMLKFYNGTDWINATGFPPCVLNQPCAACPTGARCKPNNYVAPCASGTSCKPNNYIDPDDCPGCPACPTCPATPVCPSCPTCPASGCPSGQSCSPPCPASGCPSGQSCQGPCPTCSECPTCPTCTTPRLSCTQIYNVGSPPSCPSGYTQVACCEQFSSASNAASQGCNLGTCAYWNMGYHTSYSARIQCCKAE